MKTPSADMAANASEKQQAALAINLPKDGGAIRGMREKFG